MPYNAQNAVSMCTLQRLKSQRQSGKPETLLAGHCGSHAIWLEASLSSHIVDSARYASMFTAPHVFRVHPRGC